MRMTGRCATAAATCRLSSSAGPRLSTTPSRPSTTSTSAAASDPPTPRAPSCRRPRPRRSTRAPRCGFCAKSRSAPRRAIARSRSSRSSPAPVRAQGRPADPRQGREGPRDPDPPDLRSALTSWLDETPRLARRRHTRAVSQPARWPAVGQGRARHHHRDRDGRRPRGTRTSPHTSCATPSRQRLVRGRTDLGHARRPRARTAGRPGKTPSTRLSSSTSTTEARWGPLCRRRRRSSTPQARSEDYRPVRLRAAGLFADSGVSWLYPTSLWHRVVWCRNSRASGSEARRRALRGVTRAGRLYEAGADAR